eukprot:symbB.v1.2.017185.t1/scaffold1287.1/size126675/2
MFSSDLGICVPTSCTEDQISWSIFPLVFKQFFEVGIQHGLQFAVRFHQYKPLSMPELEVTAGQVGLGIGVILMLFAAPREEASASAKSACLAPILLILIAAKEVMLYTRWNMYSWLQSNLAFFGWITSLGEMAWQAYLTLQLLRLANASMTGQQVGRLILLRSVQLLLLLAFWQLVTRSLEGLTVNVFTDGAWYDTWRNCFHESKEPLLTFSFSDLQGSGCRHLGRLRLELIFLLISAPTLLLGSLLPTAAALLGLLTAVMMKDFSDALPLRSALVLTSASLFSLRWIEQRNSKKRYGISLLCCAMVIVVYSVDWFPTPWHWLFWPPLLISLDATNGSVTTDLALPALPVLLYVLEGYVEPHGKDFTFCDVLERCGGLCVLCYACAAAAEHLFTRMARVLVLVVEGQLELSQVEKGKGLFVRLNS